MEEKIKEIIRSYEIGLKFLKNEEEDEGISRLDGIIISHKKVAYQFFISDLKELLDICKKQNK